MKSGTKRASEGTTSKDNKKPYFQRSWTEEDEISLLQVKANGKEKKVESLNLWFKKIRK
ncbi:unnamed protein product [Arabidopsis thaliana]|uniref:(thale cress) hypothetical protein n=1 Tax=Arabidopsis thaliana TaxID=3702 RepID=A0A7G2EMJ2_ARATH|nr:unnamed protein product [Arabidopsis thaliana]